MYIIVTKPRTKVSVVLISGFVIQGERGGRWLHQTSFCVVENAFCRLHGVLESVASF